MAPKSAIKFSIMQDKPQIHAKTRTSIAYRIPDIWKSLFQGGVQAAFTVVSFAQICQQQKFCPMGGDNGLWTGKPKPNFVRTPEFVKWADRVALRKMKKYRPSNSLSCTSVTGLSLKQWAMWGAWTWTTVSECRISWYLQNWSAGQALTKMNL